MKRVIILIIFIGLLSIGNLIAQEKQEGEALRPGPMKPIGQKITDPSILKPGNPIQILWKNQWWLGSVISVQKSGKVKVHYYGWEYKWDEEMDLNRLLLITKSLGTIKPSGVMVTAKTPLKPGDALHVEWKGKWYLGSVLALGEGSKVKIHYYGWDHGYDEVVTRDRLRTIPFPEGK